MTICKLVAEQLLQFRDGTLPEEETEFLREHLQYCPPCLDLLNGYEEVVEVLKRLRPINMPEGLLERMRARLRQQGV